MAETRILLLGDSLTAGTKGNYEYAKKGNGNWAERVADLLGNLAGIGPLLSGGFRGCFLDHVGADLSGEWTTAGSWTDVVSTDAFDKGIYGYGQLASGSTAVKTYTKPPWSRAIVGFAVEWIDYTSGGTWSYRIDGGSWTNHGQTIANGNAYKRFYVATPITATLEIRAANAAGTAQGCLPLGIEPYYSTATTGIIIDNLAVPGEKLNNLVASTSGDRMARLSAVTLGTGLPTSPYPTHALAMHINDVTLANTTTYGTDWTTLRARIPSIPLGLMNPWECDTAVYNQTQQTNYRAQLKTSAAGFAVPAKVLDHYDRYTAKGITGHAAMTTAGLLVDGVHETQRGHVDLTDPIYWLIRNQLLTATAAAPTSYPVAGSQAAVQYQGKLAAVQYAAGAPIGLA